MEDMKKVFKVLKIMKTCWIKDVQHQDRIKFFNDNLKEN